MSTLFKFIIVPVAGVGGTAGTIYMGSQLVNFSEINVDDDSVIETIKDKFSSRLITSPSKDSKWESRLEKLKKAKSENNELVEGLKKVESQEELRNWCNDSSILPHEKNDAVVKGVERFCTLIIKDQVRNSISKPGAGEWKLANERLRDFDTSKLSENMKKLQLEIKQKNDSDVLEKWCFLRYEEPFINNKDSKYLDVSSFCVKVPISKNSSSAKSPNARSQPSQGKI